MAPIFSEDVTSLGRVAVAVILSRSSTLPTVSVKVTVARSGRWGGAARPAGAARGRPHLVNENQPDSGNRGADFL